MSLVYPYNAEACRDRMCRMKSASDAEIMRHILDKLSEFILIKSFSYLYNYKYKWNFLFAYCSCLFLCGVIIC